MELISVDSATNTATSGVMVLSITADLDDGNGTVSGVPYGWSQGVDDPHGLYPQVTAWMAAHPDFPVTAYTAPYVAPVDPTPLIYAIGQLQVADGSISSLSISSRIAGAFQLSTGSFYVFFTDEQADTSYLALAYDTGGVRAFVQEADKATDHFIISTTDATGTPADPTVVNFEIKRVS